jgi:dihydrofolate reductase
MSEIVCIAAVARNGAIGRDNQLLVHLSEDLKRFKRLTMGAPIVMGRKTFDSIGRPLPGRRNIVITRNPAWRADGVDAVHSLDDALALAADAPQVFVLGGGEIFAQALARSQRLELTELQRDYDGDAFFPPSRHGFVETAREAHATDDGLRYDFVTYRRMPAGATA